MPSHDEQVANAFAAVARAYAELNRLEPNLDVPRDPIARAQVTLAAASSPGLTRAVRALHLGVARANVEHAKRQLQSLEIVLSAKEKDLAEVMHVEQLAMAVDR